MAKSKTGLSGIVNFAGVLFLIAGVFNLIRTRDYASCWAAVPDLAPKSW